MLAALARRLLTLLGWTLVEPATRPAKAVMIAYPHTSNWDGFYALLANWALRLDAHWVAKASLFCGPIGWILRKMGGIPVDRSRANGLVEQLSAAFAENEQLLLVIAPEGTRRRSTGWKSGFYRIALTAGVPVALGFMDYARRETGILAYITLTGDAESDLAEIARHYTDRPGRHPAQAAPIRWEAR